MKIRINETHKLSERELNEMACVGDLGEFEIQVWRREGRNIPHVHVYNDEKGTKRIDTCVQLERAVYFSHGSRTGTLNASQREKFNEFMHKPHKNGVFASNYDFAVFLWNNMDDVRKAKVEKGKEGNTVVPDYTEIAPYKESQW